MTEPMALSLLDQPPDDDPQPSGALTVPVPEGWPAPPEPGVYHGLCGEIVQTIAPETEADPVAILSQLMVAFGTAVGRGAWFQVEATRHHPNEFLVLIGDSARARKGSSWDHVHRLIGGADPAITGRILTGLSSGEGLIWSVRDPHGQDPGSSDRRLLVIEPEFVSVLKNVSREISTLSPTLRSAWDGRPLAILTRTAPARASDAHISIIGHITATELQHHINPVELANGLLNRFLLLGCRRVRLLPEGGNPDPLHGTGLHRRLVATLAAARRAGQVRLSDHARNPWHEAYQRLAEPQPGIAGAISARAEAHTIRLALLYALLDNTRQIQPAHLDAALALWDYAQRSAVWALERTASDPLARQIHAALTHAPDGLTRTQLRDLLHRNPSTQQLDRALADLAHDDKITSQRVLTAGRPAELWTATQH
ncbi:MAG: YfjI family protein [Actinomycetota bacterium]|nr:YfjI family protein [Actinomycetota bacterium]